jgi:hypothetical protein
VNIDNEPGRQYDEDPWQVQRCPLVDPGDLVWLRPVSPGEPAAIVAALRVARTMAQQLHEELARIGGGAEDTLVTPCLNDQGQPVVRVQMTVTGVRRLRRWLTTGGTGPPEITGTGTGDTHAA